MLARDELVDLQRLANVDRPIGEHSAKTSSNQFTSSSLQHRTSKVRVQYEKIWAVSRERSTREHVVEADVDAAVEALELEAHVLEEPLVALRVDLEAPAQQPEQQPRAPQRDHTLRSHETRRDVSRIRT